MRSRAACPSCGAANEPGERFCGECGTALTADSADSCRGGSGARRRAPPRLRPLRRPRRLHAALGDARRRGRARAALALLRHVPPADRALRRHGREVHRRRGDGRLGHADGDRGRRRAGRARGARPRRRGLRARRRGRRTRSCAPARESSPARPRSRSAPRAQGMVAGDLVNTASRVQSAAEPGTVFVGESTRRTTEQTIVYEEAGSFELKGKEGLTPLWKAQRVVSGLRGSLKSQGLEAPFVGRDRELRQIKDLFHACADEKQGTPRLGHRHRRDRQVAAGLGVLQVLRRHRRHRLLAPRPLPLLRRGRDLLGARRHGAHALPDRRGRGAGVRARRSCTPRSRSTSSTPRSGASSSRGSRTCSGSPSTRPATSRTCSPPGGSSSSAWPRAIRRCSPSRTCSGPTRACSTSSSTCSTGRGTTRSSWSRSRGRSCSSAGRPGAPGSGASRRSTSSRSRSRRWRSCWPGSCPGFPETLRDQHPRPRRGRPAVRGRDRADAARPRPARPGRLRVPAHRARSRRSRCRRRCTR